MAPPSERLTEAAQVAGFPACAVLASCARRLASSRQAQLISYAVKPQQYLPADIWGQKLVACRDNSQFGSFACTHAVFKLAGPVSPGQSVKDSSSDLKDCKIQGCINIGLH